MRKHMVASVSDFIRSEPRACILMADTGVYSFRNVASDHPSRVLDVGIMEDGLVGIAAGMALDGMIPTIYAMTPFIVERALEQLKLDFVYQKLQGNIFTLGAAYDFSMLGYSHYCAEDFAVLKNLPELEFLAPGTGDELEKLFRQCCDNGHLTYFRMSDYPNKSSIDVTFGKANIIRTGEKATVIAIGTILDLVIDAVGDEDVSILYYTTLTPFDKDTLKQNSESGRILVCEPEFVGSIDSEILECFPDRFVKVSHVGLPVEVYRNYGTKQEKDSYYGLTVDNIIKHLKELITGGEYVQF